MDFVSIRAELDAAGTDLQKIEAIYERARAAIEASPDELRPSLEAKFLDLCNQQAAQAKQILDAHVTAAKTVFKRY
jgi:hypothetical protein